VAVANYFSALEKGLLKVLSRLGVCPMTSYHGAQLFEILGLDEELVDEYFTGARSRVGGVGPKVLASDVLELHTEAFGEADAALVDRGLFRFRKGGEHHGYNPLVFKSLHKAVRQESQEAFDRYAQQVDEGSPTRLRDLLSWRRAEKPLALDDVEPASEIAQRFCTAAMSLGALSKEAHEVIAIGMNRIGGRSNSGEGGEDPLRYQPYGEEGRPEFLGKWQPQAEDWGNSAIKQIASGRFGLGPHYLVSAKELEIKMAQGSKPGEGGQIPGRKVTPEIARLRNSVPGVPLISPPPHHDIYSIEDLAQLIYDLKRINAQARVGVKLVSLAGVGTIACGVVKADADYILISGDDGGTGASPLSSIKHAGMPWELGLAETQQRLVKNGLRGRVTLRVDGGLKTGRDLVLAALLGAEEFGFGTAPLVAIGCVMARQCHLDTCPVGVATQRDNLRRKFPGTPEHVVSFMLFVAEQVRHILAQMGFEKLDDVIGRFDLLEAREDRAPVAGLHLDRLLADPDPQGREPRRGPQARMGTRRPSPMADVEDCLDQRLWRDADKALEDGGPVYLAYEIDNQQRSVGARLSGELARMTQGQGLDEGRLRVDFRGVTGQSFGVFLSPGLDFRVWGEAQDYVGKGMAGGRIVLRPPEVIRFDRPDGQVIAGNTLLYGATGGELFAAGQVGERFCVRNSGARAVVEGCGDHGCEYMTAGVAAILGPVGRNFGAGMSGGRAYLHDPDGLARRRINSGMVAVTDTLAEDERLELKNLLQRHLDLTGSARAQELLADWSHHVDAFVRVAPLSESRLDREAVLGPETREAEPALGL
jgi:glutamate synthase domain-containing protein 2/glutamate synthase domain-containing protein 3